jgi:hypothetical protein
LSITSKKIKDVDFIRHFFALKEVFKKNGGKAAEKQEANVKISTGMSINCWIWLNFQIDMKNRRCWEVVST